MKRSNNNAPNCGRRAGRPWQRFKKNGGGRILEKLKIFFRGPARTGVTTVLRFLRWFLTVFALKKHPQRPLFGGIFTQCALLWGAVFFRGPSRDLLEVRCCCLKCEYERNQFRVPGNCRLQIADCKLRKRQRTGSASSIGNMQFEIFNSPMPAHPYG